MKPRDMVVFIITCCMCTCAYTCGYVKFSLMCVGRAKSLDVQPKVLMWYQTSYGIRNQETQRQ